MKKYISTFEIGESEYKLKDSEVRTDLGTHESNTVVHVTAEEKAYWNSKVNPPSFSAPTAKSLTYTGEAQNLLNAGSATAGTILYSSDLTNWSTTIPQETNAGTYTAYWRFVGSESIYIDSTAIEVTIAKANPVYTAPTAKTLTYNANAQQLLNAGSTSDGTISYSEDEKNWSDSVPSATNAGDYTVYWKLTGDSNHIDVASTSIIVSIAKVTPTVTAPTAKSLTYNSEAQILNNEGSTDYGTLKYSLDNENWGASAPAGTNAGDYTVYYKVFGDSNINDTSIANISCSIDKVTPTVTAPTAKVLTYSGEAQTLLNAGSTNYGTLKYSDDGATYDTTIPSATNANTYTIYYRVDGDSNINNVAATSINCTISKVTPTVTAPTPKTLTYNTQALVLANAGSTDFGTLQYSLSQNGTYTTDVPSETAANVTYYVWYRVIGDSNTNNVSPASIECMIAEKRVTTPTITLDHDSYVYSGSANQPTPTVEDGGVIVNPTEYTVEYLNNVNVGEGTVIIVDKTAGNYYIEGTTVFTITKAAPSYTAPINANPTYTGSSQNILTSGSTQDGTIQYSSDNSTWGTTIPQQTDAGTYTAYWKLVGDSNHTNVASTSVTCTIAKANPSYTAPTAKSLTYSGSAQYLLNTGSTNNGTIQYSSDGSSWSTTMPQGTNAGSYTVYWRLVGDANHTDVTATAINVSVAKLTPTVTAPTAKSGLTYTGSAQVLANAGSTNYGTLQYSLDNSTWSTTIPSGTNAGNYNVYYKVVGNSNINDVASAYISVSIAKANRSASFSGNSTTLSVGNTNTISVTTAGSPTITLSSSNTSVATISGMTVTAVSVGTTTITATIAGDSNYNSTSISYTLTVQWGDGIYAVKSNGDLELPANINTSTPNAYVGVGIINSSTNMRFFIDKRFPIGSAAAEGVCNYKKFSLNLRGIDASYLTNISGSSGSGSSIAGAATEAVRTAALNAYKSGETGSANTTNICNDSNCSTENASDNAAKYCRSIANPVTGNYNGYLGSLAEFIVVNDNQTEVNQVLNAIDGVLFGVSASGFASTTCYWTSAETGSYPVWTWQWNSLGTARYPYFYTAVKSSSGQMYCARPFFPL